MVSYNLVENNKEELSHNHIYKQLNPNSINTFLPEIVHKFHSKEIMKKFVIFVIKLH